MLEIRCWWLQYEFMKQIGLLRRINVLKLFYCNITGFIPDAEDPSVRMDDLMEIISQDGVSHFSVPCTVAGT